VPSPKVVGQGGNSAAGLAIDQLMRFAAIQHLAFKQRERCAQGVGMLFVTRRALVSILTSFLTCSSMRMAVDSL
jgi:hypothetical protein